MTFTIKNRFTGAVQFSCELSAEIAEKSYSVKLGFAVKQAIAARANLTDADLAGAYLAGANLAGANLAYAYLTDADLAGAYLAYAYLAGATLAGATLAHADLTRADLTGATLAGATLTDADLTDAKNVGETNGSESAGPEAADPAERQRARAQRFRERNPDVPVVENIDARILAIVEGGKGTLDMSRWHGEGDHWCSTTHCRAGWAIHEAGEAGKALQDKYGPARAGAMIYRASTGRVPWFYSSNEYALEDMKAQAQLLKEPPA